MAITKTEVVSVRVPPDIKSALAAAAEAERRSLASMIEVMVLNYCRDHAIAIPAAVPATKAASSPASKQAKRPLKHPAR